jgi:hypothetical protein
LEVTITPAAEGKDEPYLAGRELRSMLKGSATESLSGFLPCTDKTLEGFRAERLGKYERVLIDTNIVVDALTHREPFFGNSRMVLLHWTQPAQMKQILMIAPIAHFEKPDFCKATAPALPGSSRATISLARMSAFPAISRSVKKRAPFARAFRRKPSNTHNFDIPKSAPCTRPPL